MFQDLLDVTLIGAAIWVFLYIIFWSNKPKAKPAIDPVEKSKTDKGVENAQSSGSSGGVEGERPSVSVHPEESSDRPIRDTDVSDTSAERKDI